MNKKITGLLIAACLLPGLTTSCVQSRPSRNGVFDENQYVRKDFIVGPATAGTEDPGWILKATFTEVGTPNPLGSDVFGVTPGIDSGGQLVRFKVTENKLQMVSSRETSTVASPERTDSVLNVWSVTNVDLKYRINLDGETTNFYEENQEEPWAQRQWVKLDFAKNDSSDVAPFGAFLGDSLAKCTDVGNYSATLVPGSFYADTANGYIQWKININAPLKLDDATCDAAFGRLGREALIAGRNSATFNIMYSLVRAKPLDPKDTTAYKPMVVAEKDPIRHKYGFFETVTQVRDPSSGLMASQELVNRFDPNKDIVWYFADGFPENFKPFFTDNIGPQTTSILSKVGAKASVKFLNFNDATKYQDGLLKDPNNADYSKRPRQYGDIRYNFIVWLADQDTQDMFAGVTPSVNDPRTGETISSSLTLGDFEFKDYYVQRIDAYLKTIGATYDINSATPWPDDGVCQDGDVKPIVPATVAKVHNGTSSVYQKMQQYLQKPVAQYGNLGPQDFIQAQDDDFFRAYYALIPYQIFADPDANQYVIREGGGGVFGAGAMWGLLQKEVDFQNLAARIDRGETPYEGSGPAGLQNATAFLNNFRELTTAHRDYLYAKKFAHGSLGMHMDGPEIFSFEAVVARAARHCVMGKWETKDEWINRMYLSYWQQTAFHEFGHAMGLTHNWMGNVDKNNFPHYKDAAGRDHVAAYTSSVMEYNASVDRIFEPGLWGPYDQAAIGWIYSNTAPTAAPTDAMALGISGQISSTVPWNDKIGFKDDGTTEIQLLMCNETHTKYTPLCRAGDLGATPSEIIANEIDGYEWQYNWRNFRQYRKFWDESAYADAPAALFIDFRRFISLWEFDWSGGELADTFRRIGITNPDPNGSNLQYFTQLTDKFNAELSSANQMVAAYHKAIIQQSAGERPYRTIYDKFYGDTTQQGIILDKLFAMEGWVGLWPTDNYDQNQAGDYFASYSGIGDSSYDYVSKDAVTSMIGGQYSVYPYFVPLAVALFAQDTHSTSFGGDISARDWIGGHVFYRLDDFLAYFRDIAVRNNYKVTLPDGTNVDCTGPDISQCNFDPRNTGLSDTHNEFVGPDRRRWIWAYIADRNTWIAVERDRNTATYVIVRNYTDDVIYQQDDGAFPGGAYGAELPMKYYLDAFAQYN
jgi:hypothetical protein